MGALLGFIGGYFAGGGGRPGGAATAGAGAAGTARFRTSERAIERDPENPRLWTELGNVEYDRGDWSRAIRAYEKALRKAPNDPNVLSDLGAAYRNRRRVPARRRLVQEGARGRSGPLAVAAQPRARLRLRPARPRLRPTRLRRAEAPVPRHSEPRPAGAADQRGEAGGLSGGTGRPGSRPALCGALARARPAASRFGILSGAMTDLFDPQPELAGARRGAALARHAARRPDAAALARRGGGAGGGRGRQRLSPPRDRGGPRAFARPLGTAGRRQDDARAAHRRADRLDVPGVLGRRDGRQGDARGPRERQEAAPPVEAPHDPVPRRDPPVQPLAAGRLPAVHRVRRHRPHRRHDREPVLRAERRAALPLQGRRARASEARGDRAHRRAGAPGHSPRPRRPRLPARRRGALLHRADLGRRRPPRAQPARGGGGGRRSGEDEADRGLPAARPAAAKSPPLRQGRRGALQPDLGPPQVDARVGSGRHDLLARADARGGGGPAVRRAAHRPVRLGGRGPGRSARARDRARRQGGVRLPRAAGGLARARAGGRLLRAGAQVERALRGGERSQDRRRREARRARSRRHPQRRDEAHEGGRLRRRLPLRAGRAGGRGRDRVPARIAPGPALLPAPRRRERKPSGRAASKPCSSGAGRSGRRKRERTRRVAGESSGGASLLPAGSSGLPS